MQIQEDWNDIFVMIEGRRDAIFTWNLLFPCWKILPVEIVRPVFRWQWSENLGEKTLPQSRENRGLDWLSSGGGLGHLPRIKRADNWLLHQRPDFLHAWHGMDDDVIVFFLASQKKRAFCACCGSYGNVLTFVLVRWCWELVSIQIHEVWSRQRYSCRISNVLFRKMQSWQSLRGYGRNSQTRSLGRNEWFFKHVSPLFDIVM